MALPSFDSVALAVLFISTEGVALSVLFISKEGIALSESFISKEWIRPSPVHREMCMHSRYQSDVPEWQRQPFPYLLQAQKQSHRYSTWGSQTNILIRPKTRSNQGKLSFLGTAANIWNQLPPDIKQLPDYVPFMKACHVLLN